MIRQTAGRFIALAAIVAVSVVAVPSVAMSQPTDGDLVINVTNNQPSATPCLISYLDRSANFRYSTIVVSPIGHIPAHLTMGERNHDIVYTAPFPQATPPLGFLAKVDVFGRISTIATWVDRPSQAYLDYDGWIVFGWGNWSTGPADFRLWSVRQTTVTTLFVQNDLVQTKRSNATIAMAIDRDPGSPPYAIVRFAANMSRSGSDPWIHGAGRQGVLSTIATYPRVLRFSLDIELDPVSGDYLVASSMSGRVHRVSKSGVVTSFPSPIPMPLSIALDQDGTAWIASATATGPTIYRVDGTGTVIQVVPISVLTNFDMPRLITLYGSRKLAVNGVGKPGSAMKVRLQSRRLGDGSKPYLIACSWARRPGIRMPNREWLNLRPDDLMALSLSGAVPSVFRGFRGVTDPFGDAAAEVRIPATVPPNLGLTVFVAGIIYDKSGVRTVTNTHWFVLN